MQLPKGFTIGPGFTLVAPTATSTELGLGKLQLGPALVAVFIGGPVVAGVLITNGFAIAGDAARPNVDQFFVEPFINVNLPKGTYLVTAPEILHDWSRDTTTVPVGGGVGQVLKLLGQPVNFSVQAWNYVQPAGGADWTVKVQMQLLFPIPKSEKPKSEKAKSEKAESEKAESRKAEG